MNRKIKTIRFILITVLALLILGWICFGIYYFFFRNDEEQTEYLDHNLTINSTEVVELYEKISDLYLCQTKVSFDPFIDNTNNVTVDQLTTDDILLLIFRQLELNGDFNYNTTGIVTISLEQLENAAKQVFGYVPEFNRDLSPTFEYTYQLLNFRFADNTYTATQITAGCEAEFPIKRSELVDLKETDENLTLIVTTYEISYEQYQSNDLSNPENSIENYILENKKDLGSQNYQYVFKKDGDNYYFTSVNKENV